MDLSSLAVDIEKHRLWGEKCAVPGVSLTPTVTAHRRADAD
jgi:hypothetical protein